MSSTVRVRRRIDSLDLPELAAFFGKDVEIVVTEVSKPDAPQKDFSSQPTERYPLRGSVLRYDDPFGSAVPEEDWEVNQ